MNLESSALLAIAVAIAAVGALVAKFLNLWSITALCAVVVVYALAVAVKRA